MPKTLRSIYNQLRKDSPRSIDVHGWKITNGKIIGKIGKSKANSNMYLSLTSLEFTCIPLEIKNKLRCLGYKERYAIDVSLVCYFNDRTRVDLIYDFLATTLREEIERLLNDKTIEDIVISFTIHQQIKG